MVPFSPPTKSDHSALKTCHHACQIATKDGNSATKTVDGIFQPCLDFLIKRANEPQHLAFKIKTACNQKFGAFNGASVPDLIDFGIGQRACSGGFAVTVCFTCGVLSNNDSRVETKYWSCRLSGIAYLDQLASRQLLEGIFFLNRAVFIDWGDHAFLNDIFACLL